MSAGTYRTIKTSFWSDPNVKRLVREGKRDAVHLAVYLITNEHGHVSGIYHLPLWMITGETGIKNPEALFPLLEDPRWGGGEWGFAYYDAETEHVWVRAMLKHQGKGEKNEAAAAKQLRSVHGSFLIAKFLECYPAVAASVGPLDVQAPPPEDEEPPAAEEKKEPAAMAQAREAWAVYVAELRECKAILKLRAGDEPEATPARLQKIAAYIKSHGFDRVCDAARGMRFSDWHMGRTGDGKHKLAPERVFHHTANMHQVEHLSGLYREALASPRKALPAGPAATERRPPAAGMNLSAFRAQVIAAVQKRGEAGMLTPEEIEHFTERIDACKDFMSLKGVADDLARKPA